MADNQLLPRRDTQERVKVAALGVIFRCAALADCDPAPEFVNLNRIGGDIANEPIMQASAGGANFRQDTQNRPGVAIG